MENLELTQDFTNLQNENGKPVSGLLPVQFVSLRYVCIEGLQHKGEWLSFLANWTAKSYATMDKCILVFQKQTTIYMNKS